MDLHWEILPWPLPEKSSKNKIGNPKKEGYFCRESCCTALEEVVPSQSFTEKSPECPKFLSLCHFKLLSFVPVPIQINLCERIWGYFCPLSYSFLIFKKLLISNIQNTLLIHKKLKQVKSKDSKFKKFCPW